VVQGDDTEMHRVQLMNFNWVVAVELEFPRFFGADWFREHLDRQPRGYTESIQCSNPTTVNMADELLVQFQELFEGQIVCILPESILAQR